MITTAKNKLDTFLNNIQGDSFLAKKMRREYLSNKDVDLNNFYTMDNCAIMLMGENMSLRGSPTADDIDSILSFCSFMGVYGLESEMNSLPVTARRTMFLMEYNGDEKNITGEMVKNTNIYSFSEFCCSNFEGSAFSTVYSYFARKVNKGLSDIYYLTDKGKIISGALASHYGDDEIYLTFVSTHRSYRHKGYAKKVIDHIVGENPGKKIILMCEDNLVSFYTKLGFKHKNNIYLYTLREENI